LDLVRSEGPEIRTVLAQPKRVALLAYLAVARPTGFHRRDRLLAMFWPDAEDERARASLSRAIYFLRRELGDDVIVNRGDDEISLNPDRLWCDAAAFESHLDRGQAREALELYRGDLLPGFFTSDANGFEAWLEGERARLRDLASEGAWRLADAEKSAGNVSLAAHWANRAVTLAPFREEGVRRLLVLLDASGDRAAAVRAYEQFASHVSKELELAPAPETIALIEEIRSRSRSTILTPLQGHDEARTAIAEAAEVFQPPSVQRPRVVRRWLTGVALAAVIVAPAILLARELLGQLDADRVFVARFANLTGDANFDALGRIAADQIIQSVASTGLVEVATPDVDSFQTDVARSALDAAPQAGRQHRAGIVVSGEIHRESERLRIQAWITDVAGSRVAWAVPGITARPDLLQDALDEVTARATGAVAALTTPRFATWFSRSVITAEVRGVSGIRPGCRVPASSETPGRVGTPAASGGDRLHFCHRQTAARAGVRRDLRGAGRGFDRRRVERRAREPDAAPATLAGLDDFLEERRSRWRISGA
jgi:serine/threonine-protein kinase